VPAIISSANPSSSASIAASIPLKRKADASPASPPGGAGLDEAEDEPEDEAEDEAESDEFSDFTGVALLRDCALARVLRGIQVLLKARCVFRRNGSFCLLTGDRMRRRKSGRGSPLDGVAG